MQSPTRVLKFLFRAILLPSMIEWGEEEHGETPSWAEINLVRGPSLPSRSTVRQARIVDGSRPSGFQDAHFFLFRQSLEGASCVFPPKKKIQKKNTVHMCLQVIDRRRTRPEFPHMLSHLSVLLHSAVLSLSLTQAREKGGLHGGRARAHLRRSSLHAHTCACKSTYYTMRYLCVLHMLPRVSSPSF